MARLSLPATKGNLLKIKAEQLLAIEAVTFLEEKRDLLLGEVLRLLREGGSRSSRKRTSLRATPAPSAERGWKRLAASAALPIPLKKTRTRNYRR